MSYDFSDFGIDSVEDAIRALMKEAFEAFASEGLWRFSESGFRWEADYDDEGFWAGELPVEVSITPDQWLATIKTNYFELEKDELTECLDQWRTALAEAEEHIRNLVDEN